MTKQDQPLAWVANQLKPKLCPSHSKMLHQAWFEPGRVWDGWLLHRVFGPSETRQVEKRNDRLASRAPTCI